MEALATIDFLLKYSGQACAVCRRPIVLLDELKRARFGEPGDLAHRECWDTYDRLHAYRVAVQEVVSITTERRGAAAAKIGRIRARLREFDKG